MCCGCGRSHVLNARHFLPFLVQWRIVRLHPLLPFFKQLCLESSTRQLEFQKEQIQPWRHPYQHLLCSLVASLVSANQPHPHNSTVESDQSSIFLIPIDGVAARSCTWSLSMSTARTPSMKSGRIEVLMPSRNSIFITPSICPITHAFTLLILGIRWTLFLKKASIEK